MVQGTTGPEQLKEWEKDATDPRPRASSGWIELDSLLRKQSFGPGTLCFLAGRMHTRKTAVMANLIVSMLKQGVPVGLVALDEAGFMYTSKIASAMTGMSHVLMDDQWLNHRNLLDPMVNAYTNLTQKFSMTQGTRPALNELGDWLEMDALATGEKKRVVFIDYLALLARGKYDGGDSTRIPRLCEELKIWTNLHELTTICLHQVGRTDDSANKRYHGSTPITPEQLMYGGEQPADIILGTYRPSLDPEGNLSMEEAQAQGIDLADWRQKADRVRAFQRDTMLQLIKNRPGVLLNPQGIRLRSKGESQQMEVVT